MASVHDVAAAILERQGSMSTMKLQKLAYYAQAWHLVWDQEELFPERIQAWANGPVVYELFDTHRGQFTVTAPWPKGSPDNLTPSERSTIHAVLASYGSLTGRQLSALTHDEGPWKEARHGLDPTQRSSRVISSETMLNFYSDLEEDDDARAIDELDWESHFAE